MLRSRPVPDGDVMKFDVDGVEHDASGRLRRLDAYRLGALEPVVTQIDDEGEVVMVGRDRRWKSLCGNSCRRKGDEPDTDAETESHVSVYRET